MNTKQQSRFTLSILDDANKKEEFDTQIEVIGEIFAESADVFTLLTNVENFFTKSHNFEGSDFCIFMKSDWTSVLINSAENLPQNLHKRNFCLNLRWRRPGREQKALSVRPRLQKIFLRQLFGGL